MDFSLGLVLINICEWCMRLLTDDKSLVQCMPLHTGDREWELLSRYLYIRNGVPSREKYLRAIMSCHIPMEKVLDKVCHAFCRLQPKSHQLPNSEMLIKDQTRCFNCCDLTGPLIAVGVFQLTDIVLCRYHFVFDRNLFIWKYLFSEIGPLFHSYLPWLQSQSHWCIQTWVTVRKRPSWVKSTILLAVWPCNLTYDLEKQ